MGITIRIFLEYPTEKSQYPINNKISGYYPIHQNFLSGALKTMSKECSKSAGKEWMIPQGHTHTYKINMYVLFPFNRQSYRYLAQPECKLHPVLFLSNTHLYSDKIMAIIISYENDQKFCLTMLL